MLATARQTPNAFLIFNVIVSSALILWGVAATVLMPWMTEHWAIQLAVWAPYVALTPTLWSLLHEAIHGTLLPTRRWNERLGRVLSIVFGSPLDAVRFGHLTHHWIYTKSGGVRGTDALPRWISVPVYYARIFGGVYLTEVAAALLVWLPARSIVAIGRRLSRAHEAGSAQAVDRLERLLLSGSLQRRARIDSLGIISLYAGGFWLYGSEAWILLAVLAGRGALVSFMDNIYHHRRPGTERRTLNLSLPTWAARAILHANLHAVHHRRPGLPWYRLPEAEDQLKDLEPKPFLAAALNQVTVPQ